MTWVEFLKTNFGLWIYTHSSSDNVLHGNGREEEKYRILLQVSDGNLTCYVFSLEDALVHLAAINSSGILTIER